MSASGNISSSATSVSSTNSREETDSSKIQTKNDVPSRAMSLLSVLSALAIVGLVTADGYESFQGLTSLYRLHTERVSWDTASTVCRLEGGHLLVINSDDEAAISSLLFGRIPAFDPPLPWGYDLMYVGITDIAEEGVWRTVLGNTLAEAGYSKWRKDEPNNAVNQDCGAVDRFGELVDHQCKLTHFRNMFPFICEKKITDDQGPAYDIDVRESINCTV